MKMCQTHWQELRGVIDSKGMGHLVATSGEHLQEKLTKGELDPLWSANHMICSMALDCGGMSLLENNEDGTQKCPLCELQKAREQGIAAGAKGDALPPTPASWIDGCTDELLNECRNKNLMQPTH